MGDAQGGPMAKAGQVLNSIYQEFLASDRSGSFNPKEASLVRIEGTSVGVDIRGSGDLVAFSAALGRLGMEIQATDPQTGTVEGRLPIAQIPAAAQLAQTISLRPIFKPPGGLRPLRFRE